MKKKITIATLSVLMLATLNGCGKNETSTANSSKADNSSSSVNKMVVDITEESQTTTTTQPSETTTLAPESTAESNIDKPAGTVTFPLQEPKFTAIFTTAENGEEIMPNFYLYTRFGVEVVLPGDLEGNAQALYDALVKKHPTLSWILDGKSVYLDWTAKTNNMDWNLSDKEIDAKINAWLAGRSYKDLTLEELYEHYDLCYKSSLGQEISNYIKGKGEHTFISSFR